MPQSKRIVKDTNIKINSLMINNLARSRKCQETWNKSFIPTDLTNKLLVTCWQDFSKLLPQALFAPNGEGGCPCQTHRGAGGAQEPGWEYFAKSLN